MSAVTSGQRTAWLMLLAWALPTFASAHLVSSGMGPFYDGVAHFFISPADLVIVVALALLSGLSGKRSARWLVVTLPVSWLAGTALGAVSSSAAPELISAFGILGTGILIAINPRLPTLLPAAMAAGLGFLHGFLNGNAMATTETPFPAAIGIVTGLAILSLFLAALSASVRAHWQLIAVRAAGSWIAAIGLLTIAWTLRP